jgi:hypothetical protein
MAGVIIHVTFKCYALDVTQVREPMTYRNVDTEMWNDPWIEGRTPHGKLLFLYFWTNRACNSAGLYRIRLEQVALETGINGSDLDHALEDIKDKAPYYRDTQIIWIKNFFKHQCHSPAFCAGAIHSARKMPSQFYAKFCDFNAKRIKNKLTGTKYANLLTKTRPSSDPQQTVLTEQNSTVQNREGQTCSCGKQKRETWHDLCDLCFKSKSMSEDRPTRHRPDITPPPCTQCQWPAYPGYKDMINGICADCRKEDE